jgi:hypothetical protein
MQTRLSGFMALTVSVVKPCSLVEIYLFLEETKLLIPTRR